MSRPTLRPVAVVGMVAVLAAIVGAQAPSLQPTRDDQLAAAIVVNLLENGHIAKPELNDEISRKWCRNYLKALDPQKHFFEKADVDAFLAKQDKLDDMIEDNDLEFAREVFERYLKRNDERLKTILELLQEPQDFAVDETYVDDPNTAEYPANADEARERWRKQLKYELLQLKEFDEEEGEKAVHRLTVRYRDRNRLLHQFNTTELMEIFLSALTTAIDPHSNYMGPRQVEDLMNQSLHLSLEGIGASLSSEDGYAVVKEIVPGGAADKDGRLQPEDKIVAIKGEDGQEADLVEKKLSDVVRLIRGPRGTKVRLVVIPEDSKERKVYELTREKIELKEQRAKGQVIEIKDEAGRPAKVGVISLPTFYGDTEAVLAGRPDAVSATGDCRALLADFKKQNVQAVLIDLRDNGGGLLHEAITLSGLFIDTGPVVQVREANNVRQLRDEDEGTAYDGPLAVLINHRSASASEIFAGVIKDYDRGLIIGDSSTFGKGTVQSIVPLSDRLRRPANFPDLGALKLTIQQFYRANGESTQIKGVAPHIHIPSILDQTDYGEGKMDNALMFDKIAPQPHDDFHRVPADLLTRLRDRSDARRQASEKFRKMAVQARKVAERKNNHTISLNEAKFREEFVPDEEEDAEVKAKGKTKKRHSEREVWASDFYNDEVMAIIADYLSFGSEVLVTTPVRAASR